MAGIKKKFGEKLCHTKRILPLHFQNKCKNRCIRNMKKKQVKLLSRHGVYIAKRGRAIFGQDYETIDKGLPHLSISGTMTHL